MRNASSFFLVLALVIADVSLLATQDDHGNTIEEATLVSFDGQTANFIGIVQDEEDFDFFKFEINAAGLLSVESSTFNTDIIHVLYGSNGKPILTNSHKSIKVEVEAGEYYLRVSEPDPVNQEYEITAEFHADEILPSDDHGETFQDASQLDMPGNASLIKGHLHLEEDSDFFKIYLDTSGYLEIFAYLFDDQPWLTLFDRDANQIISDMGLSQRLEPGEYYLQFTNHYSSLNYPTEYHLLTSWHPDQFGDSIEDSYELLITDNKAEINGLLSPQEDKDYFRFHLSENGNLTVYTVSNPETDYTLLDSNGNELAFKYQNSWITEELTIGTYYVVVEEGLEPAHNYTLKIEFTPEGQDPDEYGNSFEAATSIELGYASLVEGTINSTDDLDYLKFNLVLDGNMFITSTLGTVTVELFDHSKSLIGSVGDNWVSEPLNAGTYYIRIAGSGSQGDYSIQTTFTPYTDDHGDTPEASTPLSFVTNNASTYGRVSPSTDIDTFRLTLPTSGLLYIVVSGDSGIFTQLLSSEGIQISDAWDGFDTPLEVAAGTYYISLSSDNTERNYSLDVYLEPDDHGNSFEEATLLQMEENADLVHGVIFPSESADYFKVMLSESGVLELYTFDNPYVQGDLYDSNGEVVSEYSFGWLQQSLTPGIYFIKIIPDHSFSGVTSYSLSVAWYEDDHGNSPEEASNVTIISPQTLITGIISPYEDEDYFKFTVPGHGLFELSTTSIAEIRGTLLDSEGNQVEELYFSEENWLETQLTPGTYFMHVAFDRPEWDANFHTYAFFAYFYPDNHGDTFEEATPLNFINNSVSANGYLSGEDEDYFALNLPTKGTLQLFSSGELDTIAALYDANGNLITEDDDSGLGTNFLISQPLFEGVYYLKVEEYQSGSGEYTLTAEFTPDNIPNSNRFEFSIVYDGNWVLDPAFGLIYLYPTGNWHYQNNLGWLYIDHSSYWCYSLHPELGWLYIDQNYVQYSKTETTYILSGWIYSYVLEGWIFLLPADNGDASTTLIYYNDVLGQWIVE